jgi:general secretion pathway protein E
MAELDIAEKRLPQDGRITLLVANREVDVRVSTVPTSRGERVVLRLLDKEQVRLGLGELGLEANELEQFQALLARPHGIILVTGPTGSGKTTTLYAALSHLNSPEKNIITVEDPVEYHLEGVGQMQVNPRIHLGFAEGLRSILRQDPDVIMVGEIRDPDTAEVAVQASLTGHLVLSTLHTNDAAGAVSRLVEMGVEPFLLSSSLLGVVAQRLVRMVCPHCGEQARGEAELLRRLGLPDATAGPKLFARARGCRHCYGTGYQGRRGLFQLLLITPAIRGLILRSADADTVRETAQTEGMRSLRQAALSKLLAGATTPEEVLRVT